MVKMANAGVTARWTGGVGVGVDRRQGNVKGGGWRLSCRLPSDGFLLWCLLRVWLGGLKMGSFGKDVSWCGT
jgi:hypothetical protein